MSISTHPRLSQFPATDFVNPGLGQIARLYSFYVPMQSNYSLLTINKKVEENNQEGSGIDKSTYDEVDLDTNSDNSDTFSSDNIDPVEYNNRKRKLLGDGVQSSFMNPKPIKTGLLQLDSVNKTKKLKTNNLVQDSKPKLKKETHKFQFF